MCHFFSVDRGRPQFDLFPHLAAWSQNGNLSSFKIRKNFFQHTKCILERNCPRKHFVLPNSESSLASASLADRHFAGNGEKEILKMSNLKENLRKYGAFRITGNLKPGLAKIHYRWQASSRSLFRR